MTKRKMTLIYTTEPELTPLKFVREADDVKGVIATNVATAQMRHNAALERQKESGGSVSTLAIERWTHARTIEVEIEY